VELKLDIDEHILTKVSTIADARDTTVAALVSEYLTSLANDMTGDRKMQAAELMATFERLSRDMGSRGWTRDDLYEDRLGRYGR
jgi:hypothetical protein